MLQKLQLLILTLFLCGNSYAQEPLEIPRAKMGLSARGEFIEGNYLKGYLRDDKIEYKPTSGFGIEIGVFYERKWKQQFVLSAALNLGYKEFSIGYFEDYFDAEVDFNFSTSIFEIDWKLLTLGPNVGLKVYCCKKPKIYVELGLGADFRLNRAPPHEYITSVLYLDDQFLRIEYRADAANRKRDIPRLGYRIYPKAEFGIGAEINKIDIALIFRGELSESYGLRVRYQLLEK